MAQKKSSAGKAAKKSGKETVIPSRRLCGTMVTHSRLLETDSNFRQRQHDLEHRTDEMMAFGMEDAAFAAATKTVQVVVHVVYNTAAENISTAQVKSQLKVLNRDFRATNPDRSKTPAVWKGLVARTNIKFALATKDPSGRSTTGITRTRTTQASFTDDEGVKFSGTGGVNAWPTSRYLNIWVCNLVPWLGYAQFPGGPANTDGVVILYKAFGTSGEASPPYNLGRTATHEVGHWFNLRHIWGDSATCAGGDSVNDTPNAAGPNYGKPTFPHVSCGNGPNGDMFMNYMDYVDDAAMFMFTSQQAVRMAAALASARSSL
jgi:hypothetical protein